MRGYIDSMRQLSKNLSRGDNEIMKLKYYKLICISIIIIILVSGCIVKLSESKESSDKIQNDYLGRIVDGKYLVGNIYFYHDDDRKVSCWVTRIYGDGGVRGGGISCIPDEQINMTV